MISGLNSLFFGSEVDSKVSVALVSPTNIFSNTMYSAILDELCVILKAECAALISDNHKTNEFFVDLARGDWQNLIGIGYQLQPEIQQLMTKRGETNLYSELTVNTLHNLDDFVNGINFLTHIPLTFAGYHLGAIWLGHNQSMDSVGFALLDSISDVISNSLYVSRFERTTLADGSETVHSLVKKLALWDSNTFNHSLRMVPWAKATAKLLGCTDPEVQTICWATLLHDVGKLSVPKSILYKPGILSKEEWSLVRLHPSIGARMVSTVRKLSTTREIIGSHHEKCDGSGYPYGLVRDSIPLGARILAVVDAYGAMTEQRVYKRAFSHTEAIDEIEACSGSHFDPEISKAFISQFSK